MISQFDLMLLARAALAAGLGFLVGWERKYSGAPARGATVGLTCFTAAAITVLALGLFPAAGADRIIAAVITGSGFLGAGVILHSGSGQVRGLTTAAGLWAMVAVGVVIGAGHELLGVVLALVVYVILAWNTWPIWTHRQEHRSDRPEQRGAGMPHDENTSNRAQTTPQPESEARPVDW